MLLRDLHEGFAWFVIVGNGLAGLWALGAHWLVPLRTRALWWFTAVVEVAIFVQVGMGVGLVAGQGIKAKQFHMFYGFVAIAAVGIIYSYRQQLAKHRYLLYGGGGLFLMGLGIRAVLSGSPLMEATTLRAEADGVRGRITLDRPGKLNPLSTVTLAELAAAAQWFDEEHPDVKVVIVSGTGRAFSAGADLGAFAGGGSDGGAMGARAGAELGRRMADAIEGMRAVTIAAIRGHCVGGGLVLASACDLRVAAESTRFAIPEVDLGIPLTWGGIPRLVRDIGPAMTKELVMTCRPFGAAEAKSIGFLNRVVADGELDSEVEALAAELAAKSALTLSATKQHVDAITSAMVGMARTWNDADSLVVAQRDPESRQVAAAYIEGLGNKP